MKFEAFAGLFGVKERDILETPRPERAALQRVAMRLHDAGFDWYIADGDVCFGVRPVEAASAKPRAGRLWKSHTLTINATGNRLAALPASMQARIKSRALKVEGGGRRYRFSISAFAELVANEKFVEALVQLCGGTAGAGLWPRDREPLEYLPALRSIQQVFVGTNAELALVQRLAMTQTNVDAREAGYTLRWSKPDREPDLVVLHFAGRARREVWAGTFVGAFEARDGKGGFELRVDQFRLVGVQIPSELSETQLYGMEASGGSRRYVVNKAYRPSGDDYTPPDSGRVGSAKIREGQRKFKAKLMDAWRSKCAVTGCEARPALVGAHLHAHAKGGSYALANGLLLRADIHALYDAGLLSVDEDGVVHVVRAVGDSRYLELDGATLHLAKSAWPKGLDATLARMHALFVERQG